MSEETWDAVAKVATIERVLAVNGSPSDITTLIEESVKVALATELARIARHAEASGREARQLGLDQTAIVFEGFERGLTRRALTLRG